MKRKLQLMTWIILVLFLTLGCSRNIIPTDYTLNPESKKGLFVGRLEKIGDASHVAAYVGVHKENDRFYTNLNFSSQRLSKVLVLR